MVPHCRGAHLVSLFIRTFFRTIRREWGNMDKYRVDKFYTLTRMYIHEIYKYMASRHWNLGIIRLFNDAMFEEVLNQTPNGLRYHFIDIALEELAKVNSKAPMPLTEATFLDTLEPYLAMCQTGAGLDTVQSRAVERILEQFLDGYSVVSEKALEEEENDESSDSLILDQVHVATIAQFIFELASDPETKDQYRKSLYDMHKKYMRRLKKVGKDVEVETIAEENVEYEEDDEEMPQEDVDGEDVDGEDVDEEDVDEEDEMQDESEQEEEPEPEEPVVESGKKSRKKKQKEDAANDDSEGKPTSKKNKKKRKQTQSEQQEQEEVVTISLSEQKEAKKGGKKKKDKRDKESKDDYAANDKKDTGKGDRRVQWQKTNRSKSYKASMKALVTADVPKTASSTLEKGILLNKGKIRRAGVTKKTGRKKAVHYF